MPLQTLLRADVDLCWLVKLFLAVTETVIVDSEGTFTPQERRHRRLI